METKDKNIDIQEYVITKIGTKYLEVLKKDCTWGKKKS
jgi:DNA-binding HxlR family transcriptional regulator